MNCWVTPERRSFAMVQVDGTERKKMHISAFPNNIIGKYR